MNFHVLTLFPEMIQQGVSTSIIGRAIDKGLISVNTVNIRDFSEDKHNRVDDYPYGGGAGMVIKAEPVYKSYLFLEEKIRRSKPENSDFQKPRVVYVTPQGKIFNQSMAEEFAALDDLVILCGHYEGIDERVLELIVTDNVSIGDYILTGGELPAMVMIDAISRLIPGVLNNNTSPEDESLKDNLLEYPQYTRPEVFMGLRVPEVLLSGHHANIEAWRREQSIIRTLQRRPDLLENASLSETDKKFLAKLMKETKQENN